jgi:large subunit ribosomal protein L15
MNLSTLKPAKGSTHLQKRIGRGEGSSRGGTSTKGHKGQKAISGYNRKVGFEGGQMPLQRRVPKFGFKNLNRTEYKVLNLNALDYYTEKYKPQKIDLNFLFEKRIIQKNDKVKILGNGELKSKINVEVHAFSKSAIQAIEKNGGKATLIKN